jgi:hypothetical protein
MVYRVINTLPRRWRFRAQRLWMHSRYLRDLFWQQSPTLLFQAAFVVPLVGIVLITVLVLLAPFLIRALLAYGGYLLVLSGARYVALHIGRSHEE